MLGSFLKIRGYCTDSYHGQKPCRVHCRSTVLIIESALNNFYIENYKIMLIAFQLVYFSVISPTGYHISTEEKAALTIF